MAVDTTDSSTNSSIISTQLEKKIRAVDSTGDLPTDSSTDSSQPAREENDIFAMEEINLGRKLGTGTFALVFGVESFKLSPERDEEFSETSVATRQFCQEYAAEKRYAIKCLRPGLAPRMRKLAMRDLKTEASILSQVNHPHIVNVHSCHVTGKEDGYFGYFIVMDRLSGTLEEKVSDWKAVDDRLNFEKVLKVWDFQNVQFKNGKKDLLLERLHVVHDLASALAYLHQQRIIYRDLKPGNVGFDTNKDVKLFDFGLARTLPRERTVGEAYKMTGRTGTPLYMAPEVRNRKPYNERADTYAYAHILWEVINLGKPYEELLSELKNNPNVLAERVFVKGERPKIKQKWAAVIRELLPKAWAQDMKDRPPMKEVCARLAKLVDGLEEDNLSVQSKGETMISTRRSSFL